MSEHFDPEIEDALQRDPELMRIARMLGSAKSPDPPLDDAFRGNLRRQLMDQAWDSVEDRRAWWRGFFAPQRLAWGSAAAVFLIAASVVFYTASQPPSPNTQTIEVASNLQDKESVPTQQAIPVSFNQPMDHPSTESAVRITPATAVTYSWSGDKLMYVTPKSGNLAPNTQYQVTIGAGAKAQNGTPNPSPQTITFVTTSEPSATPSPTPSPSPSSPTGLLTKVGQLTTDYPGSGTAYPVLWAPDSSTVYLVGAGGALESISTKDGAKKTLVADGVSLPAISQSGNKLAYVRGGKIEILDLSAGTTAEVTADAAPSVLAWAHDQLYWAGSSGLFRLSDGAGAKVADLPSPDATFVSISPDGGHAIAAAGDGLSIVDTSSGKATALCTAGCATAFQGWSPDGSRLVYGGNIADLNANTVSSIPPGEMSWSKAGEILVGSDTGILEVRPDGSDYTNLAQGTFHLPVWAPDSTTFVFVRSSALWIATAPEPTPPPPAVDQALSVVKSFMKARVAGESEHAMGYLDANGKTAYAGSSPALIPQGDPGLKRFYILMSEVDPTTGAVRVVVRLVFSHGKVEQLASEETLTLVRAQATDPYLIDAATAGPQLQLGKGPEVVIVKVTPASVAVTFDSDLQAQSISNVTLQDDKGAQVTGTVSFTDRTVTFSGLQLTPGAHYRLVVLPGIQDVGNHNPAAEYDLDFVGPGPAPVAGGENPPPSPSPSPSPAVTPSS